MEKVVETLVAHDHCRRFLFLISQRQLREIILGEALLGLEVAQELRH